MKFIKFEEFMDSIERVGYIIRPNRGCDIEVWCDLNDAKTTRLFINNGYKLSSYEEKCVKWQERSPVTSYGEIDKIKLSEKTLVRIYYAYLRELLHYVKENYVSMSHNTEFSIQSISSEDRKSYLTILDMKFNFEFTIEVPQYIISNRIMVRNAIESVYLEEVTGFIRSAFAEELSIRSINDDVKESDIL